MPPSRFSLLAVVALALAACRPDADGAGAPFPRTGLAVSDSAHAWCAEFLADSTAALEPGHLVTIVFPGPAPVAARHARVAAPLPGECPAEFPQPRWDGYVAYRLELTDPLPADAAGTPSVALVVAGAAPWTRAADGVVRADLDGDGQPEEARRCTADEGEHLTIWSLRQQGGRIRRWHEYYDWGGFTDPTCPPGENGEGPAMSTDSAPRREAVRR
jgi:predicted small secreted protein